MDIRGIIGGKLWLLMGAELAADELPLGAGAPAGWSGLFVQNAFQNIR